MRNAEKESRIYVLHMAMCHVETELAENTNSSGEIDDFILKKARKETL